MSRIRSFSSTLHSTTLFIEEGHQLIRPTANSVKTLLFLMLYPKMMKLT